MAQEIEIIEGGVEQAYAIADKITSQLQEATSQLSALLSSLEGSQWSGQTRDTFISYVSILLAYQKDLEKTSKKQKKALKVLKEGIGKFESSAEVSAVKGL